jgi:hypothetical protein
MPTSVSPTIESTFTRTVSGASESLAASIDSMEMPFEADLEQYAEVTNNEVTEIIAQIKNMLLGLQQLNIAVRTMFLTPSNYADAYSSSLVNGLTSALAGIYQDASAIGEFVTTPTLKLDPADHSDSHTIATSISTNPLEHQTEYTNTITITLTPSDFDDLYTHTLDQLIRTYVSAPGTGLDSATEQAIYDRARARILEDASRTAKRISADISKRLPYSGLIADGLIEADQDVVRALADVNNKILEEQARLTYQSAIDRINQAIAFEKDLMSNFHMTQDRLLKAYATYDDELIKKDSNEMQNFHLHKDRKLKGVISYDELQLKLDSVNIDNTERSGDRKLKAFAAYDETQIKHYIASIEYATLVYKNRQDAINAAISIEQIFRKHYADQYDRQLRADSKYEELAMLNHWNQYEYLMKQYIGFVSNAVEFVKSSIHTPEQLTFNNYLQMAKLMAEGQLRIAAMVSDLTPSGQTLA